jgi:DNA-binding PadR family transcriptional regulator
MTATADPRGPKFSDDEVLAVVCQLGAAANAASLQRALSARLSEDVDLGRVEERLERLRREGLVRVGHGRASDEMHLRLTAAGVERLQALQRQPLRPPTD